MAPPDPRGRRGAPGREHLAPIAPSLSLGPHYGAHAFFLQQAFEIGEDVDHDLGELADRKLGGIADVDGAGDGVGGSIRRTMPSTRSST